eukprot:CAMPEP_0183302804 /NCGR_PEP_ID=MMETSP0160_2-20130417/8458_1 /TAXON_ID=2839 ORGANISM="Odontella Sinensis, Strain Grunow 1884" /NCGR_SAMPLE_ID=MMETSP0160_2 /ASSEMBLY_ACC=CAM_ASM_000250 /LENGTH=302 /DNA_ID=CAMNT_0025465621 /DNA_START=26 /DNA_END=930 /DNA_ORIENTATION=-
MDEGDSSYSRPPSSSSSSGLKISVDVANSRRNATTATPQQSPPPSPDLSFDERRKRIVEWLCRHIQHLNELSQIPFDSAELWRLHQHFFNPSVQDINSGSGTASPAPPNNNNTHSLDGFGGSEGHHGGSSMFSQPHAVSASSQSSEGHMATVPVSEPSLPVGGAAGVLPVPSRGGYMGTLPMLKRKVSYRFLNEALLGSKSEARTEHDASASANGGVGGLGGAAAGSRPISKMIEDASGQSMQPKSKRARRNRTRISFLPRIKGRLDSYLDACHHKALVLMRQLQFVERSLLSGQVYPLEGG